MKHLTIADNYELHNLCVEAIALWQSMPHSISAEMRTSQIDKYKKLIDKLELERKEHNANF